MRKVVMQTAEPASTREATEILVKILNGIYFETHLNIEEITLLLRLLEEFKDLFDGTLGY